MTKFILLFLTALTAHAATVRLAWDASPSWSNGPLTYVVYTGTNSGQYFWRLDAGTNFTYSVTFTNVVARKWWFAVAAMTTNYVESDLSNEVMWDGTKPAAPTNLTVVMERSPDLTNWAEFYRLKITR